MIQRFAEDPRQEVRPPFSPSLAIGAPAGTVRGSVRASLSPTGIRSNWQRLFAVCINMLTLSQTHVFSFNPHHSTSGFYLSPFYINNPPFRR